ncbi:VOC family protein [Dactylosporangium sp. NPDC005572]|uniref:VOC family protein n=1 Tax=Dactylosporangium sp. NPDC005572 TaxID=3156889 RepID=UPI0033B26CD2
MIRALSMCALPVDDVDRAVRFYRDVLGFAVHEGDPWVTVSPPSQPDVRIVLDPGDAGGRLAFTTDDCDATFEHVEASGAEVMQEPITRPGGVRDCAFTDPAGNLVRFTQRRG